MLPFRFELFRRLDRRNEDETIRPEIRRSSDVRLERDEEHENLTTQERRGHNDTTKRYGVIERGSDGRTREKQATRYLCTRCDSREGSTKYQVHIARPRRE
jgi:hypothetical protein